MQPKPEPLFDTRSIEPPKCSARGCPGRASLCRYDADVSAGVVELLGRRPKSCLNGYDPMTAEVPF